MPRISRSNLVSFTLVILILGSVPLAGARPLETSPAAPRIESGWFMSAWKWLEDLVGFVRSAADGAAGSPAAMQPAAMQKDGGGNTTNGGPCIDPHGHCGS